MKISKTVQAVIAAAVVATTAAAVSAQLASAEPTSRPAAPAVMPKVGAVPHSLHQQPNLETHFVPITPCRIADTRSAGGALRHGATRSFSVAGTAGFPSQGGHSGGCGIPVGAASVSLTMTALGETGGGALTVYPAGITRPLSRALSFSKHVAITATTDVSLAQTSSQQLSVYNAAGSGSSQLLLDVNGYYIDQIEGLIYTGGGDNAVYTGSPRILSVTNTDTGSADVTIDRDVTYCAVTVSAYFGKDVYANGYAFSANKVHVYTWYVDSTSHNSVYANNYVYLTITC